MSRAWRHAVRNELGSVTPVLFKGWILVKDFANTLCQLDLRGCENHITDNMCEYLGRLPHVQRIQLATGPHVTGAGVHRHTAGCRIVFSTPHWYSHLAAHPCVFHQTLC